MAMKRLIITLLLLLTANLYSEEIEINASISPEIVNIGEETFVSIEVNKKVKEIIPPKATEYEIKYVGTSQQSFVSVVNGKITSKQSYIYQYVLIPKKIGSLTISPFRVIADKTYETSPLKLKVEKKIIPKKRPRSPIDDIEDLISGSRIKLPQITLKLIPQKNRVYQNEGLIVDLYLYSDQREAFDYNYQEVSPIRTDKAIFYTITNFNEEIQRINSYYRKIIGRYIFYPIEKGTLGISPPTLVAISPYGQLKVNGENTGIEVLRLSTGEGIHYVGDLEAKFEAGSNVINIGENLKLKLNFRGNGNLKIFSTLYNNLKIDGLFFSTENIKFDFDKFIAGKPYFTMELTLIVTPEKDGKYTIPPVKIDYFDNSFQKKSLRLPAIKLEVLNSLIDRVTQLPHYRSVNFKKNFKFLLFNPFIIIWLIIITILPAAAIFYNLLQEKLKRDETFKKKFLANKRLDTFLKDASIHLTRKEYREFYLALQKAIFYYIADKFNLSTSMSFKKMLDKLKEKDIDLDLIEQIEKKYNQCQSVYSGKVDKENAIKIFNEVKKLLAQI